MKYLTVIFFLCTVCMSQTIYAQQDAMSVWADKPITIDGRIREWPSFFRFYISGARLQFDYFNDSSYLYICIKAVDIESQSRLMHAGVDIWFDATGKKKQKSGISFPMKLERAPGDVPRKMRANSDPSTEPSERSQASRLRQNVIFAQNEIRVTGIVAVKEPTIALQNKYGIEIAYDWDSLNILSIEYKIPLSLIYQHQVTGADIQHPVAVGIVVGALELPHNESAPASTAGGQNAQRGGMSGNGMGGGSGSRGGGQQNNLANDRFTSDNSEQKVWLKVHLETKPAQ
jgi:hypothetical protein